jgi:hypothetical protein
MASPRLKRYVGALLGAAAPLLSAGILLLTSSTNHVIAAQSTAAREPMRLPDATEFPSWERPLTFSKTYYVDGRSPSADDAGPGTRERPFRTIAKAADVLQPDERVVIAEGIYREAVQPKRGGTGADRMISYEGAEGANVIIRGSMVLKDGWRPAAAGPGRGAGGGPGQNQARTWDVDLDGSWFAGYNPFGMMNMPQQRWQYMNRMSINVHNILVPYTRVRGMMFVDGKPLDQVRATAGCPG